MKTALYYFSGTGNSYAIAKKLQSELGDCELISIMECIKNKKNQPVDELSYSSIGFVFPLYFFSMPKAVIDFIENINLTGVEYVFAVVTRGGAAWQGGALSHLKAKLEDRGYCLNAGFYIRMPDNYIAAYNIPSENTRENYFNNADQKLGSIIPKIISKAPMIEREYSKSLRPLVHHFYLKNLNKIDAGFYSDEKCNSCGLCEKICHCGNINIENEKPKWNHNCQFCLACIHYCPNKAIQYKKGTANRGRYHHPDVPVTEYIKI